MKQTLSIVVLLALAGALVWAFVERLGGGADGSAGGSGATLPVPVQVAAVETADLTLRRSLTGTLEAAAELTVASQVAGRLARLEVDLGDPVKRGQLVAVLDDAAFLSAVQQADAELAVARASLVQAQNAKQVAGRSLERTEALRRDGVTSDAQLDLAQGEALSSDAREQVAAANVLRAESALESARIRLGYARITADWSGGDDERVVAQRFVDEGGSLSANTPLLTIIESDPIVCVLQVAERDYGLLKPGQPASLSTDSYPGQTFPARVERIAPVFRSSTRQARVELQVANGDERLRPGMFARATLTLDRAEGALAVPYAALTERAGVLGVFELPSGEERVRWRPVQVGIQDGDRVQILGASLEGRVVVLGQDLCDDGSLVTLPLQAGPGGATPGGADPSELPGLPGLPGLPEGAGSSQGAQ